MAKYYSPCDTFADVEKLYNDTKVLKKRDKELHDKVLYQDIRPTNCRARWYERVIKITRNKYVLHDGERMWGYYVMDINADNFTPAEFKRHAEATAPIVWERNRDGSEVLTVRNQAQWGMYTSLPTSRVDFLCRHLPRGWYVHSINGNQILTAGDDYAYLRRLQKVGRFVLPHNTFMPKYMRMSVDWEADYTDLYYCNATARDRRCLEFVRRDGEWQQPKKTYGERKWRVDKKAKAKHKKTFKSFADIAIPMMSMMDLPNIYRDEDLNNMKAALRGRDMRVSVGLGKFIAHYNQNTNVASTQEQEFALRVMQDSTDEHFIALLKCIKYFAHQTSGWGGKQVDYRERLNRWINSFFGYIRKVEVKHD